MIGITLTSEQIRNAPADVRRWIEREVMMSLGQQVAPENGSKARSEHLATCTEEEITAILAQIEGVLPAVNVFFEFGRQGAALISAVSKRSGCLILPTIPDLRILARSLPVSMSSIKRLVGYAAIQTRGSAGLAATATASSRSKPRKISRGCGRKSSLTKDCSS